MSSKKQPSEEQKEQPKKRLTKKAVAAALREVEGNMAAVARMFKVSRQAVHDFVHKYDDLKAIMEECRESFIDNVQSALYSNALAGNVTAQIFVMKTIGRTRGFSEFIEIGLPQGVDLKSLSDQELLELRESIIRNRRRA